MSRRIQSFLILSALLVAGISHSEVFDRVAAIVDNEIILLSEVEELRAGLQGQPGLESLSPEEQRKRILERLIDDKILLAKAKDDTAITIGDKEIERMADAHIQQLIEKQGGKEQLQTLIMQYNGLDLDQFKAQIMASQKEQALKQKLQMKYVGRVEPSHRQVKDFYEEYRDSLPAQENSIRLEHIQLPIKANPALDTAAKAFIDSLIDLLDKGSSFAELAEKHSDDFSRSEGGDLGFTKKGSLDPDYERAAFRLNLGEYTPEPVRSRLGWHAVRLTAKRDNAIRTSHILKLVQPTVEDTTRTISLADSLKSVAGTETDFKALAKRYSSDKKTAHLGGELGWYTDAQLNEAYRSVVEDLKEGEVSEPVKIGDSYHLFRVAERKDERKLSLEEDWDQILMLAQNYISNQKISRLVEEWKKEYNVENRLADAKTTEP